MNTSTVSQHAPIHPLRPTLVTTPDQMAALALQPAMGGQLAQSRRWHMSSNKTSPLLTHAVMGPSKGTCDPLLDLGRLTIVDTAAQQAANEGPVGDAQLSECSELLASMLELPLEEGVYGISADGNCLFINATGAAMLGYQPEDVIDKNLLALIHHRRVDASAHTPSECLIDSVLQGGAGVRVDDAVFWGKDGAGVAVSYSASPLVLQDQDTGVVVVFKRVAEYQQAKTVEDAKVRARSKKNRQCLMDELIDADRRRVEFVATLAHELRHPLAPISHGLSLLRMGAGSQATVNTVDMMERQVSQMTRLIDGLLDIARISSGKVELNCERVTLSSIIIGAIETSLPLIESMHHDLVVDSPDDAMVLDADPARLVQILVNLLGNAAKYTPGGGCITISARREGQEAVITVADTGVGIPKESLASVFEMFSQAAPNMRLAQGGLGIGLALVRQFVELHGGTVNCASPGVGHGSTFAVRLPLAAASLDEAPLHAAVLPSSKHPAKPARGLRILVVDDDEESARSLAAVLELKGLGHVVAVASEGRQAVQMAKDFKPEVAFIDISMPGMDGYEVAQALRQVEGFEKMKLVALTGWGGVRGRARTEIAGFDYHLVKPTKLGAIDALLSEIAALPEPAN